MGHSDAASVYLTACDRASATPIAEFVETLDRNDKIAALSTHTPALNDVDLSCIAAAVRRLPEDSELRVLSLEENSFGLEGVQVLMEAIEANPFRIREIRLGKNNLKDQCAVVIGQALCRTRCGLKVLDLSENGITKLGVLPIANALESEYCELVELSFHNNKIEGDAASSLATAISGNTSLKHLHIGYNTLRDTGAIALAQALPQIRQLATLDLTANRIGTEGGTALAKALCDNRCGLQRLNLRHNLLDSEGVEKFEKVLRTNHSLIQLFLGFMSASPENAERVLSALLENNTLLLLDIYGWKLQPKRTADLIQDIQRENHSLAALVTDACQPIAKQIDEGNVERDDRGIHPLYVGPDDRDAYLATKSLKRFSLAQSRRTSRNASRNRSQSANASQGGSVSSSVRRVRRYHHAGDTSSRASSNGRRSRPRQRIISPGAGSGGTPKATRSSVTAGAAHQDVYYSSHHNMASASGAAGQRPFEYGSAAAVQHESNTGTTANNGGFASPPRTTGAINGVQEYQEDRDVVNLLRELASTPADRETQRVVRDITESLLSKIKQQRRESRVLLSRIEKLERRRECVCNPHTSGNPTTTSNPPQNIAPPVGQLPAASSPYNYYSPPTSNSNFNRTAPPPTTNTTNVPYGGAAPVTTTGSTIAARPTTSPQLNSTLERYRDVDARRTSMVHTPAAAVARNPHTASYSMLNRSLSRAQNDYQERAVTPLVHPSELHDQPPPLARTNEISGERRPEETSLQRSASVINFPPRMEQSPAQDTNPPRRKAIPNALIN